MQHTSQHPPQSPVSQQPLPQLSLQYFSQIPQLSVIQQPFILSQIDHQLSVRDLDTQFQLIRALTQTKKHKLRLRISNVLQNKKNRYPQQSIYQHTRLKLSPFPPQQLSQKRPSYIDYINANYLSTTNQLYNNQHCLILTQAPLKQTLNDFIQVIVNNNIQCVVMLCNVCQNGKNKCYDYLNSEFFYNYSEINNNLNNNLNVVIKNVKIKKFINHNNNNNSQSNFHQLTHIFFTSWPDKNVPENPLQINPILTQMLKYNRILIHCSAGLGRSGVVAVLYKIIKQHNKKLPSYKLKDKISIFKTTRQIREDRYGAVQNNQQYKFIYQYIKYYKDLLMSNNQNQSTIINC